jgi:Holliday junction resolvasome RuvABC ATP-dependent DNA helicase subunit
MNEEYFKNIVGQASAKKKLGFFIDNYKRTGKMKSVFLNAPKGCGKTTFARSIAATLKKHNPDKEYVELNCGGIRNAKQFCESVLLSRVVDRDVTVLFDESHALKSDVQNLMLTMFNTGSEKNRLAYDEFDFDIDFRRQTFLFATTEADKVDTPLKNRLEEIHLQTYTEQDLAQIIFLNIEKKNIIAEESTVADVASVVRQNAREAVKMADHIVDYMHGKDDIFGDQQWQEMRSALDILPLGISPVELAVLREIRTSGTSLSDLTAATGMSKTAISGSAELFLRQNRLMYVGDKSWRYLTQRGADLLKEV